MRMIFSNQRLVSLGEQGIIVAFLLTLWGEQWTLAFMWLFAIKVNTPQYKMLSP